MAIIGIALCSRAVIEGDLHPEEGYRLSGYYIQKCDNTQDPAHLLHYRNRAIELGKDARMAIEEMRRQHERTSICI